MSPRIPLALLREQAPNIAAMAAAGGRSSISILRPRVQPPLGRPIDITLPPPSKSLVDHYAAWCGAPASRYANVLPPHLCSHWAFGLLARLGGQAPYNLLNILNQGVSLRVNTAIPRAAPLSLRGTFEGIEDNGSRVRIHMRVVTGFPGCPEAIILDNYCALVRKRSGLNVTIPADDASFNTVSRWSADRDDGKRFALLTGDVNPIHTWHFFARRTRYQGCILHGFASLARSYEALLNEGFAVQDLDLRFVKPLPLPSRDLQVQIGQPARGKRALPMRLVSETGQVHLAGEVFKR